jgi:amidase
VKELCFRSATTLARLIRQRQVSSEEVVKAHLDRIDEVNPKLNAVVQIVRDRAVAEARAADAGLARGELKGPLHGVPITVKDCLDTAGVITTAGTSGRASHIPERDATVVARLRSAGAILVGKTNLPELCMAPTTNNAVYGRTNNPYDLERTPGGSSGGEAAIVAAGGSPLGIGTDIYGSIRLPSHCCGVAGIKPTSGRVPRTGDILASKVGAKDAWAQVGPIARAVEDLILVLPIISGVDWKDPGITPMPLEDPAQVDLKHIRVAFFTDNGVATPTPETIDTVRKAAGALMDVVRAVREDQPELPDVEKDWRMPGDTAWQQRLLEECGWGETDSWLKEYVQKNPDQSSAREYVYRLNKLNSFRSSMLSFLQAYDIVLSPVWDRPAALHGEGRATGIYYTVQYNKVGWPAAVVRCGTSPEGLPIGVQIAGRPWREHVVLSVAQYLELAFGGWQQPPL